MSGYGASHGRRFKDWRKPQLDDRWYEAFADAIHSLGKSWPDQITMAEHDFAEREADRKFPRPLAEREWKVYREILK